MAEKSRDKSKKDSKTVSTGGKKMPPISQWNPVLVRLYEKVTDFHMSTQFKDVAEILGVTPHDITGWMRGKTISQPKMNTLAKYLADRQFSPPEIVYILFGQNVTESGAFRLLNDYNNDPLNK